MKSLVLVRHGKSSWKYNVLDRERPLKLRGKNDAKLVASKYLETNKRPEYIYSSPANRALSTCKIFVNTFKLNKNNIKINENLYDFSGYMVMDFIKSLPNNQDEVILFGHNYAFTSISNLLGSTYIDNLPTSGLVKINFETNDWKTLNTGKTVLTLIPKNLKP